MSKENGIYATSDGIFSGNELESDTAVVDLPAKAYPIGYLNKGEEIHADARNVAEIYVEVDGTKLSAYNGDGSSKLEKVIERKLRRASPSEITFCFWGYTDSFPISKEEMRILVELSEEYSDVVTPPIQEGLLRAVLYDDSEPEINYDDEEIDVGTSIDLFHLYKVGVERFLEASEDSDKVVMAPIPFLQDNYLDLIELISTYEEYSTNIEMLCFNFFYRKLTSEENEKLLKDLVGYLRLKDMFDSTLKYGINIRYSYAADDGFRSAEDLVLAALGFDVIGENHWRLPNSGYDNYEELFRIFDDTKMLYREFVRTDRELSNYWPDDTNFTLDQVRKAKSDDEIRRLRRLVNAERVELALSNLRELVESESTYKFTDHEGVQDHLLSTMRSVAEVYNDPLSQTTFKEFGS